MWHPTAQVRLVREKSTKRIFAMKSMIKEAMIMKNQVEHVHAERDVLATAESPRVVTLHYSFQVCHVRRTHWLYLRCAFLSLI